MLSKTFGYLNCIFLIVIISASVSVNAVERLWDYSGVEVCKFTSDQFRPTAAASDSGGVVITWQDRRSGDRTYAQKLDRYGNPVWLTNGVRLGLSGTGPPEERPTICSDGSGGAIVVWDEDGTKIIAQHISSDGILLWGTGIVICDTSGSQQKPRIIGDNLGGAIIIWKDSRDGGWDIYTQRVASDGTILWDSQGVLIRHASENAWQIGLISDGLDGAIIYWIDWRSGNFDVYAQHINGGGIVEWTINGAPICTATGDQMRVYATSDGFGGAIITWEDARGGNHDVYAQRIDNSGSVLWTYNGITLSSGTRDQNPFGIISDGCNGAIIAIEDERSGDWDIYAQRVSADGLILWPTNGVAVCSLSGSEQWRPQIASNNRGGAILTWWDYRNGSHSDIYAQEIDSSGAASWTENGISVTTSADNQYFYYDTDYGRYYSTTNIVLDGDSGAIVVWQDHRSDYYDWDTYTQRIGNPPIIHGVTTDDDWPGEKTVYVNGDILIPEGDSVIIPSNTRVFFDTICVWDTLSGTKGIEDKCDIIVFGKLEAENSSFKPNSSSPEKGMWGWIRLDPPSHISTSRIYNCDIYYSTGGIHCTNQCADEIRYSYIYYTTGNALTCVDCPESVTIANNSIFWSDSSGIKCVDSSPTLSGNSSSYNDVSGIVCLSSSSPVITGNNIRYNDCDGIYSGASCSPEITNNYIYGNDLCGVHCSDGFSSLIGSNEIHDNNIGILVEGDSHPIIAGSFAQVNDIYDNTEFGLKNASGNDLDATYNYWGATSEPTIEANIFDEEDSVGAGAVNFLGWTNEPHTILYPKPTLISPEDDDTVSLPFNLFWSKSTGTNGTYTLQMALNSAFTDGLIERAGIPDTFYLVTAADSLSLTTYYWRVMSVSDTLDVNSWYQLPWCFHLGPSVGVADNPKTPGEIALLQNVPNPFNSSTSITVLLPEPAVMDVEIFDISGRYVASIASGQTPAGEHTYIWDGRNELGRESPDGIYLIKLRVDGEVEMVRKAVLAK